MDDAAVMNEFRNLKQRVGEMEQILPTLATKEDLRREAAEGRRHTDERTNRLEVLIESVRDDVRLIAGAQVAGFERQDRMWDDVRRLIVGLDQRVTRIEARTPPDAAL